MFGVFVRCLSKNKNLVSQVSTTRKKHCNGFSSSSSSSSSSSGKNNNAGNVQQTVRTSLNAVVDESSSTSRSSAQQQEQQQPEIPPSDEIANTSTAAILSSKTTVSVPSNVAPTTLVADFDASRLNSSAAVNSGRNQTFLTGVSDQGFQINAVGCYGGVMLFPRFFTLWDQVTVDALSIDAFKLVLLHQPRPTLLLVSFFSVNLFWLSSLYVGGR